MKILKYIVGILAVLLLLFFVRGMFTPSIDYDSQVTVNKSAKEAWAVMSDVSKLPEWLEGFKRTELVSGTFNTVGAVSNIYIDDGNGEEMVMKETITSVDPYDLYAMSFTIDFMDMDYAMHFDEKNGKTTLTSKTITKGNGIFAKSLMPFLKGTMKAQEDANMEKLKNLINANTTNYFAEEMANAEMTEESE